MDTFYDIVSIINTMNGLPFLIPSLKKLIRDDYNYVKYIEITSEQLLSKLMYKNYIIFESSDKKPICIYNNGLLQWMLLFDHIINGVFMIHSIRYNEKEINLVGIDNINNICRLNINLTTQNEKNKYILCEVYINNKSHGNLLLTNNYF